MNRKTIRQNLMLLALSLVLFAIARNGFEMMTADPESFGIVLAVFASIGFTLTATALFIRLWNA